VALSSVSVDVYCDRYYGEEDLMLDKVSLVEELIEDISFFEFD
jgi:hypothetical protein